MLPCPPSFYTILFFSNLLSSHGDMGMGMTPETKLAGGSSPASGWKRTSSRHTSERSVASLTPGSSKAPYANGRGGVVTGFISWSSRR